MKSDYLRNKIGLTLLALSFLVGIGLASSTAAQAQRPWERNQNRQVRRDRDRDDRRDRDYRRDRANDRNRDNSRNRDYGRNDQYGRSGDYGGYGGYGNSQQIAINQGYQDGLYTGSRDAQRGQSYNPQRSHFYQNGHGDSGGNYRNGYGYEQAYRNGFLRGYDEGFRRNGGYNRGNGNNGRRFPW